MAWDCGWHGAPAGDRAPAGGFHRGARSRKDGGDACGDAGDGITTPPAPPDSTPAVYTIPVVVHVIHNGEPIGVGTNLSVER